MTEPRLKKDFTKMMNWFPLLLLVLSAFTSASFSSTVSLKEELMYPKRKKVEEMSVWEVADILQLSYTPNSRFVNYYGRDEIIREIASNFCTSVTELSEKDIKFRKMQRYRHPEPASLVLAKIEADPRIATYLGFGGCLKIIKLCLYDMSSITFSPKKLPNAVSQLEDFMRFFLNAQIMPFPYKRGDPEFNFEEECMHYLMDYQTILNELSMERLVKTKSLTLIVLLVNRFKRWIPDNEYARIYSEIKTCEAKPDFQDLRKILPELARLALKSAYFTDPEPMAKLYEPVQLRLLAGVGSANLIYIEMLPVLRALLMLDQNDAACEYLERFFEQFKLSSTTRAHDAFLAAINFAIYDTDFLPKAVKQRGQAKAILTAIFKGIKTELYKGLRLSVNLGLLNVSEALLLVLDLSPQMQDDLVELAIRSIKDTSFVELLVMVLAYCSDFNAERMLQFAAPLKINALFRKTNFNKAEEVGKFNRISVAKILILRAASFLRSLPVAEADHLNRIAWSCPPRLFDTEFKLFLLGKRPAPASLEPHLSSLNFVQMMLAKHFAFTFFETRFVDEHAEAFDWKETLWFANFMIEKNLPAFQFTFYDPVHEALSARPLYNFTYETLYYRKVKEQENLQRSAMIK